jgi:hypothetical protein
MRTVCSDKLHHINNVSAVATLLYKLLQVYQLHVLNVAAEGARDVAFLCEGKRRARAVERSSTRLLWLLHNRRRDRALCKWREEKTKGESREVVCRTA